MAERSAAGRGGSGREPLAGPLLFLFDDAIATGWAPFALTRPASELRYGRWLARERLGRWLGAPVRGVVVPDRPWLHSFREEGAPPVSSPEALGKAGGGADASAPVAVTAGAPAAARSDRVFLSSRAVPDEGTPVPERPANLWIEDELVGCRLRPGTEDPGPDWFRSPSPLPGLEDARLAGETLRAPWDLVARGAERLRADLGGAGRPPDASLPRGVERIGGEAVVLGSDVRIEPGVLLDTREGPIELDAGVEVRAGCRLQGPLYAGPGSRLLGGSIAAASAGPLSYLRGEIEEATILGHSNKAHDGFLGHAYLGRWVNLGAMTTNSDLKNNYGSVRVGPPGAEVDTGLLKLGCFLGDHVKTGIGVLLNTGTVVGAGSNLFGTEMPPRWVPPFSWGSGRELVRYRKEAFLETAATAMARRGARVDDALRRWLAGAWEAADR